MKNTILLVVTVILTGCASKSFEMTALREDGTPASGAIVHAQLFLKLRKQPIARLAETDENGRALIQGMSSPTSLEIVTESGEYGVRNWDRDDVIEGIVRSHYWIRNPKALLIDDSSSSKELEPKLVEIWNRYILNAVNKGTFKAH